MSHQSATSAAAADQQQQMPADAHLLTTFSSPTLRAEDHVCPQLQQISDLLPFAAFPHRHRELRKYRFLSYWDSLYGRPAATSFEAELEIYKLLGQDAEGDLVDDEGLDLSTGAILMA
jgi:hypothetical protein